MSLTGSEKRDPRVTAPSSQLPAVSHGADGSVPMCENRKRGIERANLADHQEPDDARIEGPVRAAAPADYGRVTVICGEGEVQM